MFIKLAVYSLRPTPDSETTRESYTRLPAASKRTHLDGLPIVARLLMSINIRKLNANVSNLPLQIFLAPRSYHVS